MNEIKTIKIWKYITTILVALNIILMLVMWLKPNNEPERQHTAPRDIIIGKLKFTSEQIKNYDSLIAIHRSQANYLRDKSAKLHEAFFEKLKNNQYQPTNTDSILNLIAATEKENDLMTFNHFKAVRAICNKDQQQEFDTIINEVLHIMKQGNNRRPDNMPRPPLPADGNRPPPPNRDN